MFFPVAQERNIFTIQQNISFMRTLIFTTKSTHLQIYLKPVVEERFGKEIRQSTGVTRGCDSVAQALV